MLPPSTTLNRQECPRSRNAPRHSSGRIHHLPDAVQVGFAIGTARPAITGLCGRGGRCRRTRRGTPLRLHGDAESDGQDDRNDSPARGDRLVHDSSAQANTLSKRRKSTSVPPILEMFSGAHSPNRPAPRPSRADDRDLLVSQQRPGPGLPGTRARPSRGQQTARER
jgi:hypothetical protein